MKLYEISQKYLAFLNFIENDENLDSQAINDTIGSINAEFDEKADNIACLIKKLNAEVFAIKFEISNLEIRKNRKLKAAEKLTKYLKNELLAIGKKIFETPRNKIQIRKNPPSVTFDRDFIVWATNNATHYLNFKSPEPDKTKIKEALKNGEKIPHACLIQKERIDIK